MAHVWTIEAERLVAVDRADAEADEPSLRIELMGFDDAERSFADRPLLGDEEILRCVALFRLILPSAYLRFAGGVARLPEDTVMRAYRAGINSAILGDMLTTAGTDIEVNFDRIRRAGYEL